MVQDRQGLYTDIKIGSNTDTDGIMVFLTDYYNAICIDRFPSQTKIGKHSWYFNNSLLCTPNFSSTTKTFLFLTTELLSKIPSRKKISNENSWGLNQKTLDTIIGKNHSEVIKNRILSHTLSTICYVKNVSNKLNKNLSEYL